MAIIQHYTPRKRALIKDHFSSSNWLDPKSNIHQQRGGRRGFMHCLSTVKGVGKQSLSPKPKLWTAFNFIVYKSYVLAACQGKKNLEFLWWNQREMIRPVGLWWERKVREWKATLGNLPERCALPEKNLFVLWYLVLINLFWVIDQFPLEMLIFQEFAQESELLWAAPAVVFCYVNHCRACLSSLLGSWQEVLLIQSFSGVLKNCLDLSYVYKCVYICICIYTCFITADVCHIKSAFTKDISFSTGAFSACSTKKLLCESHCEEKFYGWRAVHQNSS